VNAGTNSNATRALHHSANSIDKFAVHLLGSSVDSIPTLVEVGVLFSAPIKVLLNHHGVVKLGSPANDSAAASRDHRGGGRDCNTAASAADDLTTFALLYAVARLLLFLNKGKTTGVGEATRSGHRRGAFAVFTALTLLSHTHKRDVDVVGSLGRVEPGGANGAIFLRCLHSLGRPCGANASSHGNANTSTGSWEKIVGGQCINIA